MVSEMLHFLVLYEFQRLDPDCIRKPGQTERFSAGLYGGGSYFADAFCKANQYAQTPNARGQHCVLYCRVLVGHAYCTDSTHGNQRHPPPKDASDASKGFHDSIYAEIDVARGGSQKHNEFVIFENGRVVRVTTYMLYQEPQKPFLLTDRIITAYHLPQYATYLTTATGRRAAAAAAI